MRKILLFTVVLISANFIYSQKNTIVAEFGGQKLTLDEFKAAYEKNAGNLTSPSLNGTQSPEDFLKLYVNYKMKLMDAADRGLLDDPALQKEYVDYKKQVGVSFITDKYLIKPGMKSLYERAQFDLRASHIIFKGDSAEIKANYFLDKIQKGEISFEEVARKYSADEQNMKYGGDVGYISAGMALKEFEKAAYECPIGEIYPKPVKTRIGYHIIKITERQKRRKEIRVSHILIQAQPKDSTGDAKALETITLLQKRIANGEDFGKLAEQFSADKQSAVAGGDLGFIKRRLTVREFDIAAFKLKVDEVSDIIKTRYGYHLIKCTDERNFGSFEDEKEELQKLYKSRYYEDDLQNYFQKLKGKYNFVLNEDLVSELIANKDSLQFNKSHLGKTHFAQNKDKFLYKADGVYVTLDSILTKALTDREFTHRHPTKDVMDKLVLKYAGNDLMGLEAMELDESDVEFKSLMDDYEKGIYIFKLQEEEVWNKLTIDSTEVYNFYLDHKSDYKFPARADFSEIFAKTDSSINALKDSLTAGIPFDTVAAKYTERENYRDKAGRYPVMEVEKNVLARKAFNLDAAGEYTEPFYYGGGWFMIKLNEKFPVRQKSFEEAKNEVIGHYQEEKTKELEQNYIDSLSKKYQPVLHIENLKNVVPD